MVVGRKREEQGLEAAEDYPYCHRQCFGSGKVCVGS